MQKYISDYIRLDPLLVIRELEELRELPWNNGCIHDDEKFPNIDKLFKIMNSGIPEEDFFFRGDIFRIHSCKTACLDSLDMGRCPCEIISSCSDGSCSILLDTQYTLYPVSFSKNPDFTRISENGGNVFYKVIPNKVARIIHVNTGSKYGIDVNAFLQRYGYRDQYFDEEEVLFPIDKNYVVHEYKTTPNKMRYYFRNF